LADNKQHAQPADFLAWIQTEHPKEMPEWIVVPLTHGFFHSIERQDQLKVAIITKGKMR
jgi:hypothetical protein